MLKTGKNSSASRYNYLIPMAGMVDSSLGVLIFWTFAKAERE